MLLLFQATATQLADSTQIAADKLMEEAIANADGLDKLSLITQQLVDFGIRAGERILIATLVFIVGRFLISMLNRFVGRLMDRRKVDISIKTFVKSLVNILLTILLIISVVGALGVETTSFAALLASAGVAVGMALFHASGWIFMYFIQKETFSSFQIKLFSQFAKRMLSEIQTIQTCV